MTGYRNDGIWHPSSRLSVFNFANLMFLLVDIGLKRPNSTSCSRSIFYTIECNIIFKAGGTGSAGQNKERLISL